MLEGRWIGRRYGYDSERGFAGEAGTSPVLVRELEPGGRFVQREDDCESAGTFRVVEEHGDVVLYLARDRHCREPARHEYPSYVHRLDAGLLVLIDGMTAGVSAFRRE